MSFLNCFTNKASTREERKFKSCDSFQKAGLPSPYNSLADTNLHIEEVSSESDYKRNTDFSGFDTARESDAVPTAMAELTTPQSKAARFSGQKQADPSLQFVKELPARPEYR